MKASELIKELEKAIKEHGDLKIGLDVDNGYCIEDIHRVEKSKYEEDILIIS